MSSRLANIVKSGPAACYGMEWTLDEAGALKCKEHYNPEWRQEYARRRGLKGLYTTVSAAMVFQKGEGLVGKVFEKQEVTFSKSLQVLHEDEVRDAMFGGDAFLFKRTQLAKDFGIHSAILIPTATSVVEIGAMQEVSGPEKILSESLVKAVQSGADIPEVKLEPIQESTCAAWLKEVVEASPEACYGIEWALVNGKLELKDHYNPWWRLQFAQQAGLKGLFTTASKNFNFEPGEGVVGAVYQAQKQTFLADMQNVTPEAMRDAMFTGDDIMFKRVQIARQYDVHSAVFVPVPGGVVEVGSMKLLKSLKELWNDASDAALKARPAN
mmetsp:Transcript_66172/g.158278  ORF Transcript_66172/g.158278 Transcript_66172/m.158278 type:complete len:326 (+) Transcript_66172:90-1067(+)